MPSYTKYAVDVKENLSRIRHPGREDDGICEQRVIFINPKNIYTGKMNCITDISSANAFSTHQLTIASSEGAALHTLYNKFGRLYIDTQLSTADADVSCQVKFPQFEAGSSVTLASDQDLMRKADVEDLDFRIVDSFKNAQLPEGVHPCTLEGTLIQQFSIVHHPGEYRLQAGGEDFMISWNYDGQYANGYRLCCEFYDDTSETVLASAPDLTVDDCFAVADHAINLIQLSGETSVCLDLPASTDEDTSKMRHAREFIVDLDNSLNPVTAVVSFTQLGDEYAFATSRDLSFDSMLSAASGERASIHFAETGFMHASGDKTMPIIKVSRETLSQPVASTSNADEGEQG